MADQKISAMTLKPSLDGDEKIPLGVEDIGVGNLATSPNQLKVFINSGTLNGYTGPWFVSFIGGLEVEVIWPIYYIDGVQYPAGTDSVTLDAADATDPRFDAIILTSAGLDKITGTPSSTPEQPPIDPTTQLLVTYVLVQANQTDLDTGNEIVYDEGTETTVTSNNGTLDDQSTDITPVSGTYVLKLGSFNNTHYIDFEFGSLQNRVDFDAMRFFLWLVTAFSNTTYLRMTFFNSATPASSTVNILSGAYNFLRTTTGGWQTIVLPLAAFTWFLPQFNRIRITFNGSNTSGFYLDAWTLNAGVVSGSPLQNTLANILTDSGIASVDQPGDTFQAIGKSGTVVTASGKVIQIEALPKVEASGTDTYTGTLPVTPATDQVFRLEIPNNNTGPSTFNPNGTGAKPLKKNVTEDLAADDLKAGGVYIVHDDGTNYQVIGIGGSGGGGGHTIQDDGTPLTQRTNLNFVGSGVAVTDDAGNDATVVTIGGGGATPDLEAVLTEGNDGGALQIKNIANASDPQDAATLANVTEELNNSATVSNVGAKLYLFNAY